MFRKMSLLFCIILMFGQILFAQTQTAKSLFEQGVKFQQENKLNEALDSFKKSLQLDPKQSATHANIGIILFLLNRVQESIAPLREAIKLEPNDAKMHIALCRSLSILKNHEEAIQECKEAYRLDSNSLESNIAMATVFQSAGYYDESIQKAILSLQKFENNLNLLQIIADSESRLENYDNAARYYEKLVQLQPKNEVYLVNLTLNYMRLERDADAVATAQKVLDLNPQNEFAYMYIGQVYFELGQNEEAIQAFQKATELNPTFNDANYFLAISYKSVANYKESLRAFRKISENNLTPLIKKYDFYKDFADVLQEEGFFEESLQYYKKLDVLIPNDFGIKFNLGEVYLNLLKFDEAINEFQKADNLRPGSKDLQMFLDIAKSRKIAFTQLDELKNYVAKKPQDLQALQDLADYAHAFRKFDLLESLIGDLVRMMPKDNKNYNQIAVYYTDMKKPDKAIEYYQKAVEAGPHHVIYSSLGMTLFQSGRKDEALLAFRKAFELKPDSIYICIFYGKFLVNIGRRSEALEVFKKGLEADPTDIVCLTNIICLNLKLGKIEQAKYYYNLLKNVDSSNNRRFERLFKFYK